MLALNANTLALYDELERSLIGIELHRVGLLFVSLEKEHLKEYEMLFDELGRLGYSGEVSVIGTQEARVMEPALSKNVAGGIHAVAERHVRPESLTTGLVGALGRAGATLNEDTEVTGLDRAAGRGWIVRTLAGAYEFDRVAVASGAWSAQLLRPLGFRLPLEGAKGYSLTFRWDTGAPSLPLYFIEAKVALSPFDSGVRLAGTLELTGLDLSLNRRRLDALTSAARRYLDNLPAIGEHAQWAGLRPLSPDGLPYIGEVPGCRGLYLATGHSMLGITLAPSTGSLLAALILDQERPVELEPFRVDRYT